MLCAYYGGGARARALFEGTALAHGASTPSPDGSLAWDAYLGAFDVVRLVMTDFVKRGRPIAEGLARMQRLVVRDMKRAYPAVDYFDGSDVIQSMEDVYSETGRKFVVVIDEFRTSTRSPVWVEPLRAYEHSKELLAATAGSD